MYHYVVTFALLAFYLCLNSVTSTPFFGEITFGYDTYSAYKWPASCGHENFCFDMGENYPKKEVEAVLKRMQLMSANNSDGTLLTKRFGGSDRQLTFRGGDVENDDPDCPPDKTDMYRPIYYIKDEFGVVRVVIQSEYFEQIFTVKRCKNPGQITYETPHFVKETLEILEKNYKYKIECAEVIANFDFFVLSEDGGYMETAKAIDGIPVYCRSRYSRK